jgi:hypothetical protein
MENKRNRQEQDGGANYYQDNNISQDNWVIVNKINDILSVSFSRSLNNCFTEMFPVNM